MSGRHGQRSSNREDRSRSDDYESPQKYQRSSRREWNNRDDDGRDDRGVSNDRFGSRPGSYNHRRRHDESENDEQMESLSDRMERLFSEQSSFIARTVADTVSREMASIKSELRSLHEKMAQLADSHETLANRVAALEEARAREAFEAASSPRRPTNAAARSSGGDPDWDRDPLPNVLRVGIDQRGGATSVSKVEVAKAVENLLDEKAWSHDIVSIEGRDVGRAFSGVFSSSNPELGQGQAKEIMGLLHRNNTWRTLHVKDVAEKQVQLFFNPDASRKDGKLRASCRRLIRELRDKVDHFGPETDLGYRASDGRVFCNRAPLAQVSVTPDSVDVKWIQKSLDDNRIDKEAVTASFLSKVSLQWVS